MLFDRHSARKQVVSKIRTEREEFFHKGLKNVSAGRDFRNHVVQCSSFVIEKTEAQKGEGSFSQVTQLSMHGSPNQNQVSWHPG